jgi:hypothetical protein
MTRTQEEPRMPFIHATWTKDDQKLNLNVDQIVAVIRGDPNTIIQTSAVINGSAQQFPVHESYEDIVKWIAAAQVYGAR